MPSRRTRSLVCLIVLVHVLPPASAQDGSPSPGGPITSSEPAEPAVEGAGMPAEPTPEAPIDSATAADELDAQLAELAPPPEEPPPPRGIPSNDDLELRGAVLVLDHEDVLRTGGSVALVDERELNALSYADPTNVVQRVPGVSVRVEDGFGLRPNIAIRGTNPERSRGVTLMEDGILFGPAPYSAPAAYYFPLVTRMTAVEVFKGPAAILYGPQTMGGAVNFVSRGVPDRAEGRVELSYGSYGTRRVNLFYGATHRRVGFLVEVADVGSRGFKEIDYSNGLTGFARTEMTARGYVESRTTRHVYHRLEARFGYSRERSQETYLGLTDADFRADPDRRYVASEDDLMQWQRFAYDLQHRLEVGAHVQLVTTLYRRDFHRLWHRFDSLGPGAPSVYSVLANPSQGANQVYYDLLTGAEDTDLSQPSLRIVAANNDRTFVSQGVQSVLRADATTGAVHHEIEAGLRLHNDSIVRNHTSESYVIANHQLVRDGQPEQLTRDEKDSAIAIAVHASYALEVGRVRVVPGLRTELIRTASDDYLNGVESRGFQHVVLPGLGLNVRLAERLHGFAGVHRGFSPVAPGQSANVKPELGTSVELGARLRDDRRRLHAELAGFFNDYSNLLITCAAAGSCPDSEVDTQYNAGEVWIGGLEASYHHDIALGPSLTMPVSATYAFMVSSFRDAFTSADPQYADVEVGDSVPYMPTNQATLRAGLEHERFGVRAIGTFVGRMREEASQGDEGTETDLQAILDFVGEIHLARRLHLTFRVENATNARPLVARRPMGARPYRPLLVAGGVRVDL